ncbi:type II secretion system protein M [Rheinheimera sp. YQF-2]|uniref:Type II secretion system protein M n=1 Tax=Rheinheimera lutimaris TaxID=2740584 RepID=A0A7Y5ATC8_9GAMM|nr:type II secretion system protein M [Rheinheimera lutimaris]NRQ44197.1 type II secretion system protein M [Rheinheimera lutimaris]
MKQQFLSWWTGLQQREQRLVAGAAVVVVIGLFYWLLWQPLHQAKQTQQQKLQTAQRQLSQLQQLIPQLKAAGAATARSGGSLAQIISNSARSGGIKVSRMQPQNEQLTLVLEDVSFEQLLSWLHALQYQHGIKLVNVDLATADKPGIVRVRRMVVE